MKIRAIIIGYLMSAGLDVILLFGESLAQIKLAASYIISADMNGLGMH